MFLALPEPYPNETVYSICARFTEIMRFHTYKGMNKFLFKRGNIMISNDLPRNLQMIAVHYPRMTIDQLIAQHTPLPFYAPFMQSERLEKVKRMMIEDTRNPIVSISGLGHDSLAHPKFIRYCPKCAINQRQQYGEAYWDRLHQLPGILTCAKHDCWLELSEINPCGQHKHFTAQSMILPSDQLVDRNVGNDDTNLTHFATNAQRLLERGQIAYPSNDLKTRYKSVLAEQGYATYTGSLHTQHFYTSFTNHYSHHTLAQWGFDIQNPRMSKQLAETLYVKQTKHPIHHLLIIGFLGYDIDTLFSRAPKIKPFGDPPWPCLNPVCDQYQQPIIEQCVQGICRNTLLPLGTFICPKCGFCNSRQGMDTEPAHRYTVGLVRSQGHVWEKRLKQLWSQHPGQTAVIARKMQCNYQTVVRHARAFGLMEYSGDFLHISRYEDIPTQEAIDSYRLQWQQINKKHPNAKVKELKKSHSNVYYWLYRHDYDWLIANTPERKGERADAVDWKKLDKELSEQIVVIADEIRSTIPPIWVSPTAVAKKTGKKTVFGKKHRHKIPQTILLLDKITETSEQYALRRLDITVARFAENGVKGFTRTRLRKEAGISKWVRTQRVERKIEELIAAYKPP